MFSRSASGARLRGKCVDGVEWGLLFKWLGRPKRLVFLDARATTLSPVTNFRGMRNGRVEPVFEQTESGGVE
jgi:hypothetical protein